MILTCNCGYEWNYRGKLKMATCPSCLNKVELPKGGDFGN